uniref:Transposase domain-containing protein n=1 Tax=Anopheles epiroticus TaxID=199890 RepID=A0A182PX67_9DIPT
MNDEAADCDVEMEYESGCDDDIEEEDSINCDGNIDFSNMTLEDCLRFYALSTNQTHSAINLLLEILSSNLQRSLPKSARTLLKTRRSNNDITNIPGGQLWYHGPLVDELKDILVNGIMINSVRIFIRLRAIIADSPARAYIKGCAYFNGIHGCMKCTCEGEYNNVSNTVVFKSINAQIRTDKGFRDGEYPEHVKLASPLLDLPSFNIITDVITSDALHLFYLGVMKRLLLGWRDGKLGKFCKWSADVCNAVSSRLEGIALPSEIHRRFRRLDELNNWKGTEFASFLHYAGIVVLKKVLPIEAYDHFLMLFCAVTILSSVEYKPNWPVAGKMLETFILQYGEIYGEQYLTSNIHNLQH